MRGHDVSGRRDMGAGTGGRRDGLALFGFGFAFAGAAFGLDLAQAFEGAVEGALVMSAGFVDALDHIDVAVFAGIHVTEEGDAFDAGEAGEHPLGVDHGFDVAVFGAADGTPVGFDSSQRQ